MRSGTAGLLAAVTVLTAGCGHVNRPAVAPAVKRTPAACFAANGLTAARRITPTEWRAFHNDAPALFFAVFVDKEPDGTFTVTSPVSGTAATDDVSSVGDCLAG